jgi:hypothetical protein
MADVTVVPEQFSLIQFDAGEIAAAVGRLADEIGLGERRITIEVDEYSPLGYSHVLSLDPLTIKVESGAFEDAKRPRHLSHDSVTGVIGRLLFRARDRLDPAFGDPPPDDELSLAQHVAWDVYAVGRAERIGYPGQRERRRYHFRIRHGFTDVADRVFERLWSSTDLTWADIDAASAEAAAARPVEPKRARAKSGRAR